MATQTYQGVDGKTYPEGGSAPATPIKDLSNQIGQYVTQNETSSGGHSYTESGYLGADGSLSGTPPAGTPSSAPITDPSTTPPVDTSQPSPSTVNATPYTSASKPAVVSAAQAQANLASGGLSGDALTGAQKSLSAYEQGHAAAQTSGAPAPQSASVGMSAATIAANNANTGYTPPAPVLDAVAQATQQYTDDYAKYMSSQSQGETLVQQYQDISNQLGIPALNTELMNMKNVIDGTEDDVRNEVTKAGGFATDSQVLALSNARNKTMIQNYNNLLQTKSDAMTQLTTLSGLAAQDRQYASDQIDKQLNFDQQQITFATNAQTNAQNSIQKSIDNYGAASVYKQALATGDPTAVSRINSVMGNGFDLATAATAPPSLDDQYKQAEIANINSEIGARNSAASAQNSLNSILPYANQTASGVKYIDASTIQGTASQKNAIVNAAQAAGYKVITNKNEAADLTNIQNAYSNLDTIDSTFSSITSPSALSRVFNNVGLNQAAVYLQTDPQKAASTALNDSALDLLKAISGTQGFRGNQAAIAQIKDNLPTIYDDTQTAQTKTQNVRTLIQNREDAIVGGNGIGSTNTSQSSNDPLGLGI